MKHGAKVCGASLCWITFSVSRTECLGIDLRREMRRNSGYAAPAWPNFKVLQDRKDILIKTHEEEDNEKDLARGVASCCG